MGVNPSGGESRQGSRDHIIIGRQRDAKRARPFDHRAGQAVLRDAEGSSGEGQDLDDRAWLASSGAYVISGAPERTVRVWNLRSNDPSSDPVVLLGHERGTGGRGPLIQFTADSGRGALSRFQSKESFARADDEAVQQEALASADAR